MRLLLATLVSGTLTGTAVTVLVLGMIPFTRRRLSARWHRAVLCMSLFFYALPVGLGMRTVTPALVGSAPQGPLREVVFPAPLRGLEFAPPPVQPPVGEGVRSRVPLLLLIWLTGALLLLAWRLLRLRRFRGLLQSRPAPR